MSIIIGSMFYNMPQETSSFFGRGVLLFFTAFLNTYLGAFEVSVVVKIYQLADLDRPEFSGRRIVGATTNCREALPIRFQSTHGRSSSVNDLRHTKQNTPDSLL